MAYVEYSINDLWVINNMVYLLVGVKELAQVIFMGEDASEVR